MGIITAAWLLVVTLNFTLCDSVEATASYAGLAPHPRQSGTSVRGKPTIGHTGNGRLRTALYLATLSASQHNPVIKGFYERLPTNRCTSRGRSGPRGRDSIPSTSPNNNKGAPSRRGSADDRGPPYGFQVRASLGRHNTEAVPLTVNTVSSLTPPHDSP